MRADCCPPQGLELRPLAREDAPAFAVAFSRIGWSRPVTVFDGYLREQEAGTRWVRVAEFEGELAGYVTLVWAPADPVFRSEGLPEIMDLNVLPPYRRRGVATALMDDAESQAKSRATKVGLRVGLHGGYGAAQRLYVQRGYVPDGAGAIREGRVVEEGEVGPVDDHLTLRMILELSGR